MVVFTVLLFNFYSKSLPFKEFVLIGSFDSLGKLLLIEEKALDLLIFGGTGGTKESPVFFMDAFLIRKERPNISLFI
jgi:hypothetical protein